MKRRRLLSALFAAGVMLWIDPGMADAQIIPPPGRDPWPRGVPLPRIVQPGGLVPEIAEGAPSADRKVVGIVTFDAAGNASVCSGVLLTKDVILTAAHCTCGVSRYGVTNDQKIAGATWRAATLLSTFGGYNCSVGPFGGNDLALLRAAGARFSNGRGGAISDDYSIVDTIVLSARWIRSPPLQLRVEGYGYDGLTQASLGGRRTAPVEMDSAACLEVELDWTGCSVLFEFVLGMRPTAGKRRDACSGDSGGPVFFGSGERPLLVGIVSRGVPVEQPFSFGACGAGGIYTHVGRQDVMTWVKRHTSGPG
jgi:trypsin